MRRILRLFRPYRGRLAAVGLFVWVSSLFSVASPFLLREIIDTAFPQGRIGLLTLLAAGLIFIAAVTSALGVVQTFISATVGQRVMHDLRSSVYSRLQRMSLAFFTKTQTGEVQSRLASDIRGMEATVTSTATLLVSNFTSVVATMVAMLALNWQLASVSILLMPLFAFISRQVGCERKTITSQRHKQMATIAAIVTQSLSVSGIILARTMGRSDALTRAFTQESEQLADLEVSSSMAGRWRMSTIGTVIAALPALLYWAAGLVQAGGTAISMGTLVAFVSLQQGMLAPAVGLLSAGVQVQTSLALFQRIFEYLDLPIEITEPANPVRLKEIRGEVGFEKVEFAYDETNGATLSGIDITVPAGGTLAIVGLTGSGKSTLSYLVPRLYDVSGGRVTLDGVDVRDLDFDTLSRAVGIVSQETFLFHASVADNLRFAKPRATDKELQAAARAAHIHDHIASLPDGYNTVVGERGYRFSGGEKQRLAIARTILRDPPVLILDEATSALDACTEAAVQQAIQTLLANRTTIVITHRLPMVRSVKEIVVLDAGRIIERGTHEQLLAADGQYAALLRSHETEHFQR